MTNSRPDYKEFKAKQDLYNDLRAAKSRCWSSWLWVLAGGAIGSIVRSAQTGNWIPTAAATGVALVAIPIAAVDVGITFMFAPPITAGALFTSKAISSRKKLGIVMPEEAEVMLYDKGL